MVFFFFFGGGGGGGGVGGGKGGVGGRGDQGPHLVLQIFIKIFWHNHIIIF